MAYPQARKGNSKLWIVLGIFAFVCCGGAVVGGILMYNAGKGFFGNVFSMAGCMASMQNLSSAVRDYSIKNNGMTPKAETWQKELAAAYKAIPTNVEKGNPIKMPNIESEMRCQDHEGVITGIAFNKDAAGKKYSDLPSSTILFFETKKAGMNLSEPYKKLPREESPTIFGEARGWLTVTVNGSVNMDDKPAQTMTR
ncbi:MAG TPA: hypothetical protein PLO61_04185 [Fimbriimonadaceae bacterium]|nr:hypothetical protein [Fimbriimonadaceae bacterium]HRJ32839.1 hypothetical protein [Fimbriimonadaceae bacterium]